MWVRGLKLVKLCNPIQNLVAPYVGAWIETSSSAFDCSHNSVAPYVGAWIETYDAQSICFET